MSCHFQHYIDSSRTLCVQADLRPISFQAFWQDVAVQAAHFGRLDEPVWALWEPDSYEFLVLLFAALQAKKQVILPPHRVSDLEKQWASQQIYFLQRMTVDVPTHIPSHVLDQTLSLDADFCEQAQLYFYTSGSTGQPKKIPRSLQQLLNEVQVLNASFALPEQAMAIATVSHQHIYGLLFKLLWPLATGRSFYQQQLAFPEDVAETQKKIAAFDLPNYLISSPAVLKRWSNEVLLHDCVQIYSSGGHLDAGIRPILNSPITEILGSSETGGIAHRQQDADLWLPFANVEIRATAQQALAVKSQHAYTDDWILTGDQIDVIESENPQRQFQLLGRLDRIVKLEEKRLSLDAIEASIAELDLVQQCHVMLVPQHARQILVAVVVLTDVARQQLIQQGKADFSAALKKRLSTQLESIAIPRQWRFLTQMPQNAQSKLNKSYLNSLFQTMHLPVVLQQQRQGDQVSYLLEFGPELECFKGHFADFPVYPGVGQIGFIQHFAKEHWADLHWCHGFEQLKFQNLIQPYQCLELVITRQAHKISFELKHHHQSCASGRLLFAVTSAQV